MEIRGAASLRWKPQKIHRAQASIRVPKLPQRAPTQLRGRRKTDHEHTGQAP